MFVLIVLSRMFSSRSPESKNESPKTPSLCRASFYALSGLVIVAVSGISKAGSIPVQGNSLWR